MCVLQTVCEYVAFSAGSDGFNYNRGKPIKFERNYLQTQSIVPSQSECSAQTLVDAERGKVKSHRCNLYTLLLIHNTVTP